MAKISPDLKLADLAELKQQLENRIRGAVTDAVRDFEGKTGFAPRGISIQMIEMRSIEDLVPDYLVGQVEADVDVLR